MKSAHNHFSFPGSYDKNITIHNKKVVKIISNNMNDDYSYDYDIFYYKIEKREIERALRMNRKMKQKVKLFIKKSENRILYLGLYSVKGFENGFVKLIHKLN